LVGEFFIEVRYLLLQEGDLLVFIHGFTTETQRAREERVLLDLSR